MINDAQEQRYGRRGKKGKGRRLGRPDGEVPFVRIGLVRPCALFVSFFHYRRGYAFVNFVFGEIVDVRIVYQIEARTVIKT